MLTATSKSAQSAREIVVNEIARLRSAYAEKRAAHCSITAELRLVREAQPSRADLQRVLEKAVHKLSNNGLRQLLPLLTPYLNARDENEQRVIDNIYALFTAHKPHESGLFALLRQALLAGCADAAACLSPAMAMDRDNTVSLNIRNWPDGAMTGAARNAKIAELEPRAAAILAELSALENEMTSLGIAVEKPTMEQAA